MIKTSELYRLQKIGEWIKTLIIQIDKKNTEPFDTITEKEIENLLENCTQEFYLINEEIIERKNQNARTQRSKTSNGIN